MGNIFCSTDEISERATAAALFDARGSAVTEAENEVQAAKNEVRKARQEGAPEGDLALLMRQWNDAQTAVAIALEQWKGATNVPEAFFPCLPPVSTSTLFKPNHPHGGCELITKNMFEDLLRNSPQMRGLNQRLSAAAPAYDSAWSVVSKAEKKLSSNFRETIIEHYEGPLGEGTEKVVKATCFVTQMAGDGMQVTAAHMAPHSANEYWMEKFEITDINESRNVLLLSKNIKLAFDTRRLCFECVDDEDAAPAPRRFKMRIWDESTKNELIFKGSDLTIGEFEGRSFSFPADKLPYTRVLSHHCQDGYRMAAWKEGWGGTKAGPERPREFGSPLDNDDLLEHNLSTEPPFLRGTFSSSSSLQSDCSSTGTASPWD